MRTARDTVWHSHADPVDKFLLSFELVRLDPLRLLLSRREQLGVEGREIRHRARTQRRRGGARATRSCLGSGWRRHQDIGDAPSVR